MYTFAAVLKTQNKINMKKLFAFAVIAGGMFLVSCGGGSTPAADSSAATVDTMATEAAAPAQADSAAQVDTSAAAPAADTTAAPAK